MVRPLLDLVPGAAYEFAAWRTLAEVSNCDVYLLPIIAALSRVASQDQNLLIHCFTEFEDLVFQQQE